MIRARFATALAMAAACIGLAGCAPAGPNYLRPAMELPGSFPDAPAGDAASVRADWWTLYGDAALNDLVEKALANNADMRLAVAQVEEAEGVLREAGATLLPELDLGANSTRQRLSAATATPIPASIPLVRFDRRLAISTAFEIDFWGRLRRVEEGARAQALSTRYARDVVSLTLAGTVAQTWFTLRSLDAQVAVLRDTLAARDESLALVKDRAAGGLASDLDVSQAQGARADAAVQLRDLQRSRALVEHQLAALSGRLDSRFAPGDLATLPLPPSPPPGLPSALLERRPDVRAAEQNLVAANARIGAAKAAMYPNISLTSNLGGQSVGFSELLDNGARIWSLGFGLSLPIFDGGRLEARTDQAAARQRQSLASYQKAVETAFREVADAITNVQQGAAVEADLQQRLDAAKNALRLARVRYEAGYAAYLDVLDAQRNANDAALAVVRNRQSRLAYSVDLMKALGGGWSAR